MTAPAPSAPGAGGAAPRRGFLPPEDPVQRLSPPFSPWDEVGQQLPKLAAAERAAEALAGLPELDARALADAELERAMLLLSMFAHAALFERREGPRRAIPRAIARPWSQVAARLGRPCALAYASHALVNWRRIDPAGPLELGNLTTLQTFLGGLDEEWFVLSHVAIEGAGAAAVGGALAASSAAAGGDVPAAAQALGAIADLGEDAVRRLARLSEGCEPWVFYHRVRPFLQGPVDALLEGVDAAPLRSPGASAAQSSLVPLLDAALGVTHDPDELEVFLRSLRAYMPGDHRRLIERLERGPQVRELVLAHRSHAPLVAAYDAALNGLDRFRTAHLELAAQFIQRPAAAEAKARGWQSPSEAAERGTAGSPFVRLLTKHRDETRRCYLGATKG